MSGAEQGEPAEAGPPNDRRRIIWPEPAKDKSDSAGAEDGTQRPVDLRERSDLKKEKPPKGFERSDKRASVICSPGRRRRTESRLLEHAKRSGTRRVRGGRAAETTGGESFGRSLRRSNDSPEGAAARADRRRAHLASGVGRPRTRLEENHSVGACGDRMILRKDAGAGRAGAASLPTQRSLSGPPSAGEEATRQRAIRRARRSARGFRGRTRRAVLSPVAQPPGEDYGRGRKGAHNSALDVERAEIPGLNYCTM